MSTRIGIIFGNRNGRGLDLSSEPLLLGMSKTAFLQLEPIGYTQKELQQARFIRFPLEDAPNRPWYVWDQNISMTVGSTAGVIDFAILWSSFAKSAKVRSISRIFLSEIVSLFGADTMILAQDSSKICGHLVEMAFDEVPFNEILSVAKEDAICQEDLSAHDDLSSECEAIVITVTQKPMVARHRDTGKSGGTTAPPYRT